MKTCEERARLTVIADIDGYELADNYSLPQLFAEELGAVDSWDMVARALMTAHGYAFESWDEPPVDEPDADWDCWYWQISKGADCVIIATLSDDGCGRVVIYATSREAFERFESDSKRCYEMAMYGVGED